ncbi:LapA family protein [Mycobacterium sp. Marseille-P9652]|uniref:LapA family protein n=1 Tax=Mycobacterium sp. Marseille-P9652 TaxID=2654950 RepID=UPI0012E80011|nr:LapA family protein [Mycobacterium sp. Marseille-P9652]
MGRTARTPQSAHDLEERVERKPRLVVVAAAVLTLLASVANFALGHVRLGVDVASIGLLTVGAGMSWLAMERRRVRQAEREMTVDGALPPARWS